MPAKLATLGFIFTAAILSEPVAAAQATGGSPCSGTYIVDEPQTHRARSAIGPFVEYFEPWGKDGWVWMNTGDPEATDMTELPEWHFEQFNDKDYQVFGGDPSLEHVKRFNDHILLATRVREGKESDSSFWVFSQDCKQVTSFVPEGVDRHGIPGKNRYYNDTRVFAKIEPPSGAVATVADIFGGWELNRAASKLTLPPMDAETVIIIPWEKSGWIWNQISGGPYQPEDLHKTVKRVECGATYGATAVPCTGPRSNMMLYWASWDSKTFPTYGTRRDQVEVKRINDRTFEVTSFKGAQKAAQGDKSTMAFSADGRHLTATTKSDAGMVDVRVYDRIVADNWPTVAITH